MTPDPEMPAAEVILQPRIRAVRLATLLVTLRLARGEFDLLVLTWIVVDLRHMPQAGAVFPQHAAAAASISRGVLQEALQERPVSYSLASMLD
jgi:hypothetical protein